MGLVGSHTFGSVSKGSPRCTLRSLLKGVATDARWRDMPGIWRVLSCSMKRTGHQGAVGTDSQGLEMRFPRLRILHAAESLEILGLGFGVGDSGLRV